MAVTGTGTSSDPFVVSTWQELVDTVAVTTNPKTTHVKFVKGTIINLDDYYDSYAPEVTVASHNTCYIDFNNAVIVNGKFDKLFDPSGDGSGYPLYIRNVVILNARADSTSGIINTYSNSWTYFEDCVLDIHLPSRDAAFTGKGANRFTRCKVTINGNGYWSTSSNTIYNDCIIDIRLNAHTASTIGITYTALGETSTTVNEYAGLVNTLSNKAFPQCMDCYITGKLDTVQGVDGKTILFLEPYNSIVEIDCDIVSPYAGGVVLCNSDKAILASKTTVGSNDITSKGPLYKRDTDDIRNAQVLYDLGFSVDPNSVVN